MTTECICATDTISTRIYRPTKANQKSKKSVWNDLKALAGTIGDYAVEVYRYTNDQEAVISNGGPRVVIRPDRIDLVWPGIRLADQHFFNNQFNVRIGKKNAKA